MFKAPIIAAIALGTAVVAGGAALLVFSGPSAITLPEEAYDEDTVFVFAADIEALDEDAVQTIQDTITGLVEDVAYAIGEDLPDREQDQLDEAMGFIEGFAEVMRDHEIQAFAVTVAMDIDDAIESEGDIERTGLKVTILVQAGEEPDLVQIAKDFGDVIDEEPSDRDLDAMEDAVSFDDLGGGWYAVEVDSREMPGFIRIGAANGDDEVEAQFKEALSHSAGGMVQMAMIIPEDLANLMSGAGGAMLSEMPDELREVMRALGDIEMMSYAVDVDSGIGFREYLIFEDADAAERMADALDELMEEIPDMVDTLADEMGMDRSAADDIGDSLTEMSELVEISRSGRTLEFEVDSGNFQSMLDLLVEALAPAVASDRARARHYEHRAYEDHWEYSEEAGDDVPEEGYYERRRYDYAEDAAEEAIESEGSYFERNRRDRYEEAAEAVEEAAEEAEYESGTLRRLQPAE